MVGMAIYFGSFALINSPRANAKKRFAALASTGTISWKNTYGIAQEHNHRHTYAIFKFVLSHSILWRKKSEVCH